MDEHCCPEDLAWRRYALGLVVEAEQEALEEHLRRCPTCLSRLTAVSSEGLLLQDLRRGLSWARNTGTDAEVERLRQLAVHIPETAVESTVEAAIANETALLLRKSESADLGQLGPFRLLSLLGQGGMGVVYRAEDTRLQRIVAIKVLRPELANRPEAASRFLAEARAMALLKHEHIVTVHHVDQVEGVAVLAMELLEGESLEARLRHGPLTLAEVLRIGREAASGLAAAHDKDLIHRDVKPDNIFLEKVADPAGPGYRVKLLDFGLARVLHGDQKLTTPGMVVGTPSYMAPEQIDDQPIGTRADLFGLGAVLYRLCTGQLPFHGATMLATLKAVAVAEPVSVRRLQPGVPEPLAALIEQLLCKDPAGRPASARVVVETLAAIERHDPGAGKLAAPRRWPGWLALTGAVVLAGALAVCLIVLRPWRPDREVDQETDDAETASVSPIVHDLPWEGKKEHIYLTRLSPDGRWAVAGGGARSQVWEVASGKKAADLPGAISAFTPDGEHLLLSVPGQGLVRYDLRWKPIHTFRIPHELATLDVSGDGKLLVGGSVADAVRLWDATTGQQRAVLDEKRGHWVAISGDGRRVAALDPEGKKLRVWDTGSGNKLLRAWHRPAIKNPLGLWFLSDGQVLLAADRSLTWWQEEEDNPARRLSLARKKVASIGISVRAGLVVFGVVGEDEVQVWSLTSGQELGRVPMPYSTYGEIGLTPDGRLGSLAFSEQQRVIVFRLPAAAAAAAAQEASRAARPGKKPNE
jgi:serine/threonine protein kinase